MRRLLSSAVLALLLGACVPRATPATPIPSSDPSGAFIACTVLPETLSGFCRVGVGKAGGTVVLGLEGVPLEVGPQPSPVTCAGVIGGVRCDLGTLTAQDVYRLPYLGVVKTARAGFVRADGSSFSLQWP